MWSISLQTGEESSRVPEGTPRYEARLLKYARAFLLAKGATGTERGGLEFT